MTLPDKVFSAWINNFLVQAIASPSQEQEVEDFLFEHFFDTRPRRERDPDLAHNALQLSLRTGGLLTAHNPQNRIEALLGYERTPELFLSFLLLADGRNSFAAASALFKALPKSLNKGEYLAIAPGHSQIAEALDTVPGITLVPAKSWLSRLTRKPTQIIDRQELAAHLAKLQLRLHLSAAPDGTSPILPPRPCANMYFSDRIAAGPEFR